MSIEQKDKEQMEQLIASEKYQRILDKLCDIIDMVYGIRRRNAKLYRAELHT